MTWENVAVAVALIGVAILAVRRQVRKRQCILEWAARRGYTIVRRLPAWYRVSPFPLAEVGSKQSIHYLALLDREGVERRCWLRIGDWVVGHFSDEVVVSWEGPAPEDCNPAER
jgi:hypothetical protein